MRNFNLAFMLLITTYTTSLFGSHEALRVKNNTSAASNHSNSSVVIVSCSGKSGSTTLEASFKATGIETHRCHAIRNEMMAFILAKEQTGNVILIDSIRDIISRKIASFFQNLTVHLNLQASEILAQYKAHPKQLMRTLQSTFKQKIFTMETSNTFKSWQQFNYNCLTDGVFDFKKKYQLKQIGNLYFVNLRFDDIKHWGKIIRSIDLPINLSSFKIVEANRSSNKWYANIYHDFLANFTLTQQEFDTILSSFSEELAHFYTAEEIDAFFAKWAPHIR